MQVVLKVDFQSKRLVSCETNVIIECIDVNVLGFSDTFEQI